jgi:hypothetical protein
MRQQRLRADLGRQIFERPVHLCGHGFNAREQRSQAVFLAQSREHEAQQAEGERRTRVVATPQFAG